MLHEEKEKDQQLGYCVAVLMAVACATAVISYDYELFWHRMVSLFLLTQMWQSLQRSQL